MTARRSISPIVSTILLILTAVATVALLYTWLSGTAGTPGTRVGGRLCRPHIAAAFANETGIYVQLVAPGCVEVTPTAYLNPDGSATRLALLYNRSGLARFVPERQAEPGVYTLEVSLGGASARYTMKVARVVGEATILDNLTSKTPPASIDRGAYTISLAVEGSPSSYRLTVRVAPKEGYTLTFVDGEIYNSSGDPPMYVGRYYKYTVSGTVSYPDYVEWYWTPLQSGEEPYRVVVIVALRQG